MERKVAIRRIIGITALVLWVVAIVPKFLPGEDMLVWQLDSWALLFAPLLTLAYTVMLTYIAQRKNWIVRISVWISCFLFALVCVVFFFSARSWLYVKVWNNKDYAVYSKYRGAIDPDEYVLYKRTGILNKAMYGIGSDNFGMVKDVEFTIYEPLDLIKKEYNATAFESDRILSHDTIFYRLSDGKRYKQEQNDSLLALIK